MEPNGALDSYRVMKTEIRAFFLACGLSACTPMGSASQEYHVDLDADNEVRFVSQAPIEEVVGVTDRIDGYVLLDGPRLEEGSATEGTQLYLEVDLGSLDTGLGLRNRHMRDTTISRSRSSPTPF